MATVQMDIMPTIIFSLPGIENDFQLDFVLCSILYDRKSQLILAITLYIFCQTICFITQSYFHENVLINLNDFV
jgi:hypothetical protein